MGSSAYTRVEAVELRLGLFLTRRSRHVEDDSAAVYTWKLYWSQSRSNEMRWCRRGTVPVSIMVEAEIDLYASVEAGPACPMFLKQQSMGVQHFTRS